MMWYEIFKFEIKYRARRPETYIYFTIVLLSSVMAVTFVFENNLAPIKENAPYIIAYTMAVVSAGFMIISSMIMGVAALRDYDHNMESLMFINPLKKRDYLLGRFLGSFVVLVFIFSGVFFGIILGEFMPWRDTANMLPFTIWPYIQPFLFLVVPNLFFGGAIFFISGALSRKLVVVYTQGILFFIVFHLASVFAKRSESQFLASVFDPFSIQTIGTIIKYWTPIERNTTMLPMDGDLLYNRLIWLAIGALVLWIGSYRLKFNVVLGKASNKTLRSITNNIEKPITKSVIIPHANTNYGYYASSIQLKEQALFYFKLIVRQPSFWAIVICAIAILAINSINVSSFHGVESYPTTYIVVEELIEMSILFFLIILVFYSGELIWKERDIKLNLIHDALPIYNAISITGKFIGLLLTYVVLLGILMLAGIVFQISQEYYYFDFHVYFIGFFGVIFLFLMMFSCIAFFFQSLINHKYLAHIGTVLFFVVTMALSVYGFDHGLYSFAGTDLGLYSDMNGYGPFLIPYVLFKIYWVAIAIIIFILAILLSIRGLETNIIKRFKSIKTRFTKPLYIIGALAFIIFFTSGSYIFYNTNVLNEYISEDIQNTFRADYEKTLKKYEYIAQPKITTIKLHVELYPRERKYAAEGYFMLVNKHNTPIKNIHIQKRLASQITMDYITFNCAVPNTQYDQFDYTIYELQQPLMPMDSIKMNFKQSYITQGFEANGTTDTDIIKNGTFFNNDHFPTIGYNRNYELVEIHEREDYDLGKRMQRADRNNSKELANGRSGGDGYEIGFEIVIGTDADQTAIAPGKLIKEWTENERRYYQYKMKHPMINFYDIVSAKYNVIKDIWISKLDSLHHPVDLEIYYHDHHDYNIERMMKSMKASLSYFSENFSPYQDEQIRIMEFPRYRSFAQSFPGTIPFSEAMGFIMNIDDTKDADMAFYVTAHELAHQWWGIQLPAANVKGKNMITESLAQYAALMVMKQHYPDETIRKILKIEMNRYLQGRSVEFIPEVPLELVESQQYLHYGKGAVNLYALQDYISEEKVNLALKRFLEDWSSFDGRLQTDRYATTEDLLHYFKEVTPEHLQYVITDLFETITLYENRIVDAQHKTSGNKYKVTLNLETTKYRIDSLGVEFSIPFNDLVDIGIYGEDSDGNEALLYLEKHKITDAKTTLEILVDKKPTKAGIDPLHKLIDRNFDNNINTLSN